MNFCRWLEALIFVMAGASSSFEEIAPAFSAAPVSAEATVIAAADRPVSSPRLLWKPQPDEASKAAVEVVGADPVALRLLARSDLTVDRWNSFFAVRVVSSVEQATVDQPPIVGSYRLTGDVIRFEPRYPLEPGLRYRAEFDPVRLHAVALALLPPGERVTGQPESTGRLLADYSVPKKPAQPTTRLTAIAPSAELLPENLLRFYLFFSSPMSRGEAYRRITLVNEATGKRVDAPFLELDEELWSPDGTRFTLVFDPGRIKRGLRPREEAGPVLEAGHSYSLVVARDWLDASGNPLKSEFKKTFRVGSPDETSPNPKTWTINAPPADTRSPLVVRFPESLDRALIERLIWVEHGGSTVVTGEISVGLAETLWRFTPSARWRPGAYRLVVGTELEDLAGNSVARPFEVDAAGPISRRVAKKTVEVPFAIVAATR